MRKLLLPLSWLFGVGVAIRNALYDRNILPIYRSSLPVICVGNVTTGGNGKTPFVTFLAQLLRENGCHPVILLRGYGGSESGPTTVSETSTVREVGDEAVLHFQHFAGKVPVVVARDRSSGARLIEQRNLGDVIVLDDGFQHRKLFRDIDIVLHDSEVRDRLLPAGNLREPLAVALKRADLVAGRDFQVTVRPLDFVDLVSGEVISIDKLHSESVSVLTAIAKPERFLSTLQSLQVNVSATHIYRDHYLFSADEISQVLHRSNKVIVTEKDAVKLRELVTVAGKVFVLRIATEVTAGQAELCALLSQRLRRSIVSTPETLSSARVMFSN